MLKVPDVLPTIVHVHFPRRSKKDILSALSLALAYYRRQYDRPEKFSIIDQTQYAAFLQKYVFTGLSKRLDRERKTEFTYMLLFSQAEPDFFKPFSPPGSREKVFAGKSSLKDQVIVDPGFLLHKSRPSSLRGFRSEWIPLFTTRRQAWGRPAEQVDFPAPPDRLSVMQRLNPPADLADVLEPGIITVRRKPVRDKMLQEIIEKNRILVTAPGEEVLKFSPGRERLTAVSMPLLHESALADFARRPPPPRQEFQSAPARKGISSPPVSGSRIPWEQREPGPVSAEGFVPADRLISGSWGAVVDIDPGNRPGKETGREPGELPGEESFFAGKPAPGLPLGIIPALKMVQLLPGLEVSSVRIHTDNNADRAARALHARAFTLGRHIFFRMGKFEPESVKGLALLAHELVHVQQHQSQAEFSGPPLSRQRDAEQEALNLELAVLARGTPPRDSANAPGGVPGRQTGYALAPVRRKVAGIATPVNPGNTAAPGLMVNPGPPVPGTRSLQPLKAGEEELPAIAAASSENPGNDPDDDLSRRIYRYLERQITIEKERRGVDR